MTKTKRTRIIRILMLAGVMTLASVRLSAQSTGVHLIQGRVCDQDSTTEVPYANLSILRTGDSTLLTVTTANASGDYALHVDTAGSYILRVTAVGYKDLYRTVDIGEDSAVLKIVMTQDMIMLDAVAVVAEKPIYSTEGEAEVYNVKNDETVQAKSLDHALANVPGIEVNARGQVTYRGHYAVDVWQNGQPLHLAGESLIVYLKSVPASMVERVELIDNPSVRYQSSGVVINVVMKKNFADNNFLMLGGSADSSPEIIPWLSYVYSNEKISANLYANLGYDGRDFTSEGRSSLLRGTDTSRIESYRGETDGGQRGAIVAANMAYQIDTVRSLTVFGEMSFMNERLSDSFAYQRREYLYTPGNYDFEHTDTSERDGRMMAVGVMYSRQFAKTGHALNVMADMQVYNSQKNNRYSRLFSSGVNNLGGHYDYEVEKKIYNAEVAYSLPFLKKGMLNLGVSAKHYLFDKDREDMTGQSRDADRSYCENMTTNSLGAYLMATRSFGRFMTRVGVRANYDMVEVEYPQTAVLNRTFEYWSVVPSIHVTYTTKTMHSFKFNYTIRMNVPTAEQLAGLKKYDYDSYTVGNPSLRSSVAHNFQIGWNKYYKTAGRLAATGYWRSIRNDMSPVALTCYDPLFSTIINYSSYQNIGNSSATGIEVNYMYNKKSQWQAQLYVNGYDYRYESEVAEEGAFDDHALCYSLRLHASANPIRWMTLYLNANYASSTIALQQTKGSYSSVDVGVSFDLFGSKLMAYLSVEDLFDQNHQTSNTLNPYYLSYSYVRHNTRFIMAGVTYRFGRMSLKEMARTGDKFMRNDK